MPVKPSSGFERHLLTALTTIMTGLLCWIGLTTQQTAIAVAQLNVKVEGIALNAKRLDGIEMRITQIERHHRDEP